MNLKKEIHIRWSRKNTIIVLSFLGVIGVVAIAYFLFYKNIFSTQNIVLQVSAPKEIASGKNITWMVTIKNNSKVKIEDLSLNFEYPDGVFGKENSVKKRESKKIEGGLLPQQEISENFSGTVFGVEQEIKEAKAFLTYTPVGLSTQFESEASFSTRISDTSVSFLMDVPKRVNPNEILPISFKWQSVFSFPLENVQMRISLPEEFQRTSSKIAGEELQDKKVILNLGTLNENQGGEIVIRGRLSGEIGDQKLFKAEFGVFDLQLYEFVALATVEESVKITSSTLDVFRKVNGSYNYTVSPGETLNYIVEFKNTGEDVYKNLELEIELDGSVLDFSTLKATGGKVDGKKIIFSSKDFPDLLLLGPYGEGEVGFKINVREYTSSFHPQNAIIRENINFGGIEKSFQSKVSSLTSFSQEIYYNKENFPSLIKNLFKNAGPYPLQSGKETTLVVVFKIENLGNQLKNLKVKTKLPSVTDFLNEVYPASSDFVFNESSKELTLGINSASAYTPSKIFAFQVKVKPSVFPTTVIAKTRVIGTDVWTNQAVEIEVPLLDTDLIQ
ncbi:MAG: hypothetical protein V1841_00195 [Patescibacteria group bacterium]